MSCLSSVSVSKENRKKLNMSLRHQKVYRIYRNSRKKTDFLHNDTEEGCVFFRNLGQLFCRLLSTMVKKKATITGAHRLFLRARSRPPGFRLLGNFNINFPLNLALLHCYPSIWKNYNKLRRFNVCTKSLVML